jgi:hypothetical protein
MNSYSVASVSYDGTSGGSGSPNPLCWITGTVNGLRVFPAVFFAYLMAASAAGQMEAALTAIMFDWYAGVYGYQFTPWPSPIPFPSFPPVQVSATQMHKSLLEQAIATAENLSDGLFRITDSEVIAALPCRKLKAEEEFISYRQLSQGPHGNRYQHGRTRCSVAQTEVLSPSVMRSS